MSNIKTGGVGPVGKEGEEEIGTRVTTCREGFRGSWTVLGLEQTGLRPVLRVYDVGNRTPSQPIHNPQTGRERFRETTIGIRREFQ